MALAVDESKDKANWRNETNQPVDQTVKGLLHGLKRRATRRRSLVVS